MQPTAPHLIIQEGPEKGRELVIPPDGARIGRATENDISISDAAMSRFQCRMYFRDGFLYIMDLGSTNESLVNNQPVTDQALRYGDEVLIGESTLKVLNDGLSGNDQTSDDAEGLQASPSEPAPAPIVFNLGAEEPANEEPAPAPIPTSAEALASPAAPFAQSEQPVHENPQDAPTSALVEVDLGLGRKEEEDDPKNEQAKRSILPMILVALVTMLVVLTVGLIVLMQTEPNATTVVARQDHTFQLYYERVVSGNGNIFRYALRLEEDGTLHADIHDIQEQRSISRGTKVDPDNLKKFREQLLNRKDTFDQLDDSYLRAVGKQMESNDITLVVNHQAKRVRTLNHPQPIAFTDLRNLFEGFARNQLGLSPISRSPEELRNLAANSWANAKGLYAKQDVKNENLFQALQKLKEVKFLLQDLEPKPEYYDEALQKELDWTAELETIIDDLEFNAMKEYNIGRKDLSIPYLRRMMETVPDSSHPSYKWARDNLIRIEQELNR